MKSIRSFLQKHIVPANEELSQASARIIIVSFAIFYFFYHAFFHITWIVEMLVAYLGFSLLHYFIAKRYPGIYKTRILLVLFLDITITSIVVFSTNEYGLFFYSLYLWYVIGYGVRFGMFYLFITALYASLSFFTIIYLSTYLQSIPYVSYSLLLSIPILSLFIAILLLRLQTMQKQLQIQLEQTDKIANIDMLTGAPNRYAFMNQIRIYLNKHDPVALFFIDLDGFKSINDTLGHGVGDKLLKEVAERLNALCDENCFYGRLGGDEFAIIFYSTNRQKVEEFAQQILMQLNKPYLNNSVDAITASIGVAVVEKSFDLKELLRKSDQAMYRAKNNGKNRYELDLEYI